MRIECDKATTYPSGLVCNSVVQYVRASPDKLSCDPTNHKDFQKGLAEFKCFWKFRHMAFLEIYHHFLTPDGMKDPWRGTTPEVQRGGRGCNPPERGYRFQRPPAERSEAPPSEARAPPSEARPSRRAKWGSTERSEAPPRFRRAKRGRAKVIGRSPLQKNSKRFHQKAQGNHLFSWKILKPELRTPNSPCLFFPSGGTTQPHQKSREL